jgi:hypothetical protein
MTRQRSEDELREVASVVASAAITLVGCWLLAMVAGAVAILAVLLTALVYVPLRIVHLERRRARPVEASGLPRLPSPRPPADDAADLPAPATRSRRTA